MRRILNVCLAAMLISGCGGTQLGPPSTVTQTTLTHGVSTARTATPLRRVALWVSIPTENRIMGVAGGFLEKHEVADIYTANSSCDAPTGLKVDHYRNLWVGCNGNATCGSALQGCQGLVEVYAVGSTSASATYVDERAGHCGRHRGCYAYASANDVAFDSKRHVFAANLTTTSCTTKPPKCSTAGGGFTWWYIGELKSPHINVGPGSDQFFNFLDVDTRGVLYIDATEAFGTGQSQVYEVTDPTKPSWTMKTIIPPTSDQLGGVYVSNAGSVLNIVDETTRTIAQYALPWVASETPFNTLGPTPLHRYKGSRPVSGGFNSGDAYLALGDADATFNVGMVVDNKWSSSGHEKIGRQPVLGAAYVPSDK